MGFSIHTCATRRLLTVIAHMICFCVGAAQAQPYPSRPITIVVALPAGGAVDALARIIAEPMRSMLGQPIIIENLGGAGGTLASAVWCARHLMATRLASALSVNM